METFAQRLKEERIKNTRNLTRNQMADLLGIPVETYRNYESDGKRHRDPDFETLVKIATILDTTTDYLLGKDPI